ncbi:MAG: cytochrome c oxidase subunit 3 [Gammaproteobacteria bacterium]|nr:cytochrome c oxidase subunit 3 [Gammaproteobacteria bacterium]
MAHADNSYYVPHGSHWPIVASIGVCTLMVGFANFLNNVSWGSPMMMVGLAIVFFMIFGWFGTVIKENQKGMYNMQVDMSFRWGMFWFIFSEVMFFAAFFGALFYARQYSLPWLSGEGSGITTNAFIWDGYEGSWPNSANGPGNVGGDYTTIGPWGLPLLNTALLLSSGVTLTWAHHALKANHRAQLIIGLFLTVLLGVIFMFVQGAEYIHAYQDLGLTLGSGIYGTTFFMLTGFHGFHVTIGAIILTVILFRCITGHFTPERHFAFEAAAWYWHFVDVVWLGLFIFVYVL